MSTSERFAFGRIAEGAALRLVPMDPFRESFRHSIAVLVGRLIGLFAVAAGLLAITAVVYGVSRMPLPMVGLVLTAISFVLLVVLMRRLAVTAVIHEVSQMSLPMLPMLGIISSAISPVFLAMLLRREVKRTMILTIETVGIEDHSGKRDVETTNLANDARTKPQSAQDAIQGFQVEVLYQLQARKLARIAYQTPGKQNGKMSIVVHLLRGANFTEQQLAHVGIKVLYTAKEVLAIIETDPSRSWPIKRRNLEILEMLRLMRLEKRPTEELSALLEEHQSNLKKLYLYE